MVYLKENELMYISNACVFPSDWTTNHLMKTHNSRPYNPDLANTFFRAGYIESCGRGIQKICEECDLTGAEPSEYSILGDDITVNIDNCTESKYNGNSKRRCIKVVDMNTIIANNILNCLEKKQKKQIELARYLNVSEQTINKMLSGASAINAGELRKIAEFCSTTMEELTSLPQNYEEMDVLHVFMGQVKTKEAQQSIQDIDTLIDLILFHDKVRENSIIMREEWTEL